MVARLAFVALCVILIANAAEIDILEETLKDGVDDKVDSFVERGEQREELAQAAKSHIITNNYVWKDSCGCKNAALEPVCADGENFHNECEARCKGHNSPKAGVCSTKISAIIMAEPPGGKGHKAVVGSAPPKKVAKAKKKLSAKCKANLKRMQGWIKDEMLKAHLAAEQSKRHDELAKHDKSKCDAHTIKLEGQHNYNWCALADKFKALAMKSHDAGISHAHKAEVWRSRLKRKQCLKSQWSKKEFVMDHNWGGSGKRISLVWSKNYTKRWGMRWPHCYNLKCFHDATPRNIIEDACNKDEDCSGFSFTADKRVGTGCLKQCYQDDSFAGYGAITNDYWKKRTMKHIQIFASHSGVMLYSGCFHNGEQTMSWKGRSHLVTTPILFSKRMSGLGVAKGDLSGASVPKGWCLKIYSKKNYKGHVLKVPGPKNIACLGDYRMHDKVSWNNKVYSLKVFKNAKCSDKPHKKRPPRRKHVKLVNYREVPAEYSSWWDARDKELQRQMRHHRRKRLLGYKSRHHAKKAEIAKVLHKLEHLHRHDIHCEMGEKGCAKKAKKKAGKKKSAQSEEAEEVDSPRLRRKPSRKHRSPSSSDIPPMSASAFIRKLKREAALRSAENKLQVEADEALMGTQQSMDTQQTQKLKTSLKSAVAPSSQVSLWVSALAFVVATLLAHP